MTRGHGGDICYHRQGNRTVFSLTIPNSVATSLPRRRSENRIQEIPKSSKSIAALTSRDFTLFVYINIRNKETEKRVRAVLDRLPVKVNVHVGTHDRCHVILSDCMDVRMDWIGKPQINEFSHSADKLELAMRLRIMTAQQKSGVSRDELIRFDRA